MTRKQSVYRVGGLKGDHCRDRIEHTLSHLGGVADVSVDLGSNQVRVEYDPGKIASGYIEETLQSLGYSIQS
ncbi:MAG: cation transporter [Negativicutes bacterium]|nr:cation transporter [Negativicutes bacterium]